MQFLQKKTDKIK